MWQLGKNRDQISEKENFIGVGPFREKIREGPTPVIGVGPFREKIREGPTPVIGVGPLGEEIGEVRPRS